MLPFLARRVFYMVLFLLALSLVGFLIIELPPGNYLDVHIARLRNAGVRVDQAEIDRLMHLYDLDSPIVVRYFKWIGKFLGGNMGISFQHNRAVVDLIAERLPATLLLSSVTLLFIYAVSIPVGILSATRQYSMADYLFTFTGFFGLATPNFLLALVLMWLVLAGFGVSLTGLFSAEYVAAPWSLGRVWDLLKHLPIPIVVIGTAGTAELIRIVRASLLDELRKQYVVTARAKGMEEARLLFKYPVRVALNPVISSAAWVLPAIFSGETVTAIVLSLPTTGQIFFSALLFQDMSLAGSVVIIIGALTVVGTLISDLVLAGVDPRIRMERSNR